MESKTDAQNRLRERTRCNTARFSLAGTRCWARLVGAHDGDTITVIFEVFPGSFFQVAVRLRGIDTCEMTSKNAEVRGRAVAARNRLIELLTGVRMDPEARYTKGRIDALLAEQVHAVWLEIFDQDKYGRTIADVCPGPGCPSVNQTLLEERLAYRYDGETKETEDQILRDTKESAREAA